MKCNLAALAITGLILTACGGPTNQTAGLFGNSPLPALEGYETDSRPRLATSQGVIDRTQWSPTTITIPVRQVEHEPRYVQRLDERCNRLNPYPTAESTVSIEAHSTSGFHEPFCGTLLFGWEVISAPFRAVLAAPWPAETVSDQGLCDYERVPQVDPSMP